jgi:hypothetical protein
VLAAFNNARTCDQEEIAGQVNVQTWYQVTQSDPSIESCDVRMTH